MCIKKFQLHSGWVILAGVAITVMTLAMSPNAYAQASSPLSENGTCISCHEDLYFLHDTGNWFCIRESPMKCVACHGGDPTTFKQEDAHANRQPHPILNEDISKCQECHPAECNERVMKFENVAGISDVLVAVPYEPAPILLNEQSLETQTKEAVEHPGRISAMEVLILALLAGLALTVYFIHRTHTSE